MPPGVHKAAKRSHFIAFMPLVYVRHKYEGTVPHRGRGRCICLSPLPIPDKNAQFELSSANGTTFTTKGFIYLLLNLGLRRESLYRFIIADFSKPILGADFLAHYGLLPDLQRSCL